jgi:TolA-binding protein
MATKKKPAEKPSSSGQTFNIEGGVHAGRDVIQSNQYNYGGQTQQIANIQSQAEFVAALSSLQSQIAALKQQAALNAAQLRNLESADKQIAQAARAAQKPQADGGEIEKTLTEAKDTMDLLSGSVTSAIGLGTTLAGLIGIVSRLFGG